MIPKRDSVAVIAVVACARVIGDPFRYLLRQIFRECFNQSTFTRAGLSQYDARSGREVGSDEPCTP